MQPIQAICDPSEISRIDTELATIQSQINLAVGILGLPSGRIRFFTYDETDAFCRANPHLQVMAGHEAAATMAGIPLDKARGLSLTKVGNDWHLFNQSHLNRPDGQANPIQMDPVTFQEILAALRTAGMQNLVIR